MNLLFTTTYFTPYVSGLTLYVARLAAGLSARGHRVAVLCMQHDPTLALQENTGVHIVRAKPWMRVSKGFFSFDWVLRLWQQTQNTDCVIVHLPQAEGWIAALLGRVLGKRVIAVYHCEVVLPPGWFNWGINVALGFFNSLALLLSHIAVTYTEDFASYSTVLRLTTKLKDRHFLKTFYPPIEIPKTNASVRTKMRKKIGKADYVIGIAARLAREKGIEYLIDALPQIGKNLKGKKIKIAIAGSPRAAGEAAYQELIMKKINKHADHVVFLGELQPQDMGSFYALLDLLVLPSVNSTESFGMVQVEAMMMGVPVVVSDLPGVRVPVQVTGMGKVTAIGDSPAIAEGATSILQDKKRYIRSKTDIERIFSSEKTFDQYERLIQHS